MAVIPHPRPDEVEAARHLPGDERLEDRAGIAQDGAQSPEIAGRMIVRDFAIVAERDRDPIPGLWLVGEKLQDRPWGASAGHCDPAAIGAGEKLEDEVGDRFVVGRLGPFDLTHAS